MIKIVNGVKYYPVSERLLFGLESMYEKCMTNYQCRYDEFTDEELDAFYEKAEVCADLIAKVHSRGFVDGKTYGLIKNITVEREWMRYMACLNAGMNERDAAKALG